MDLDLWDGMDHAGRRTPPPPQRRMLLFQLILALAPYQAQSTFKITTPYALYVCPEGQSVTLTCTLTGSPIDRHDFITTFWYQSDRNCLQRKHIRNVTERELHYELVKNHGHPSGNSTAGKYTHGQQANHHGLKAFSDHNGTFYISMANLTMQDSGNYCCHVIETKKEHHKLHSQQWAHGFMELRIQKANASFPNCVFHPAASTENITAAALATGACIVGILCLPLILLLIYKQRQAINSRRAHELVRMDSNAHGIENPVFDDVPAVDLESKPKPQLTYMASRQQSDSGRHLLSEPNTPLSPPAPGDCFFPSLEPVPDSPNLMDV